MSNIITLPQLQQLLIEMADSNESSVDNFLKEFFGLIAETLANGESVRIKNIGQFIPHGETAEVVEFIPDKEIAEAINLPFEAFEAVELNDGVTEELLNNAVDNAVEDTPEEPAENTEDVAQEEEPAETEADTTETPIIGTGNIVIDEASPEVPVIEESEPEQESHEYPVEEPVTAIQIDEVDPSAEAEPDVSERDEPESEPIAETEQNDEPECVYVYRKRSIIPYFVVALLCLLVGFVAGYFYRNYFDINLINDNKVEEVAMEAAPDTIVEVPDDTVAVVKEDASKDTVPQVVEPEPQAKPEPKPEPVYDTVTKSRYLTTMAREYYHNLNYWVYIYEENKDILPANPNKINPGTRVVIPPFEKYAKSKNDSINLAKAIAKANEIYAPFRKK